MGSEKAWYWIAVGVLALFVSNNLAARHEGEVRCLAGRALAAVEQVSGHASQFGAMAEMMLGRGETGFAQTQTTLARAQGRLASVQAVIAQHEAAFARIQGENDQIITMQLGRTLVCPRQNLRLVTPELPLIRTDGTI
jgi:outer membrane protein TolC